MQKVFTFLMIFVLTLSNVLGQTILLSEDPEALGTDIQKALENPIGASFLELWQQQNFSAEQKTQLNGITKKMAELKLKIRPQFADFFAATNAAVRVQNMQGADLTDFLFTTEQVLYTYSRKDIAKYLSTVRLFLEENMLFKSNVYSLRSSGAFKFKYLGGAEGGDEEDTEEFFEEEVVEEENAEQDWSSVNWDELGKSAAELTGEDDQTEDDYQFGEVQIVLPSLEGAIIEFEAVDLAFIYRNDTSVLAQTTGSVMLKNGIFVGEKGSMEWQKREALSPEINAQLDKYSFDVSRNELKAENVMLNYPEKLEAPIMGVMEYASGANKVQSATYPRFKSYRADIRLANFSKGDVTYIGGVALRGSNIQSSSAYNQLAVLQGFEDGKKRFKATSALFDFHEADSSITAKVAAVIIYQGIDSIYHPAVSFEYETDNSLLRLKSAKGGFSNTPYNSSYFNMDINADMLEWDIREDSLDISVVSARSEKPVVIESRDYFRRDRFEALSGLHNFHPLLILINFSRKIGLAEFSLIDIMEETNIQEPLLRKTMFDLMQRGLIDFDAVAGDIKITRKGFHYYLSQFYRKDYDDMIIPSIISSAPNGTLYLKDNVLKMRGVESFYVSDSLDVIITPINKEVNILKNREIQFDGSMNAGNIQFIGHQITFKYDSFLVDLPKIDSIKLLVKTENGDQQRLDNQLVDTSGKLLINKPNNKSAIRRYPEFPIFNSYRTAFVYFDKPEILNSAYDSTIYFSIPPFELDSAADADPSILAFEGIFTSGGVFPDFEEKLTANPDNSLGFAHEIPEGGYKIYGTSATLHDNVSMNSDGLTSSGQIDYLTSTFEMEKSTFFLDSLYSNDSASGEMRAGTLNGTSYPSMILNDFEMNWLARQDSMLLTSKQIPFQVFDTLGDFSGTMVLRTDTLMGTGSMKMDGSLTESTNFSFTENKFGARNALFDIGPEDPRYTIMTSDNVKLDYDVASKIAKVQTEVQGMPALEFPFAQVKTSMPNAIWDIENEIITMTKPDTVDIKDSYFYTTNEALDSLAFNATGATYFIDKLELKVEGIPYITVADARITTEGKEVLILQNSKIGTLTNAVVVMDTVNAYHRLFDATIDIISRNEFQGIGTYQLVNAVQDTFAIKFNAFKLEEDEEHGKYTMSSGTVGAQDGVVISPGFSYKGEVSMFAYKKALELDGAVKLNLEKLKERNIWIEYASKDSIQEVIVDFDNARTEDGDPLNAGLHFNNGDIYLSFITEKRGLDDDDLFIPRGGQLSFDAEKGAFKVQNQEKVSGSSYAGSMFSYNEQSQDVTFEGKMNFIGPNNQGIKMEGSGIGSGNLDSADFKIDAMIALDYELPEGILPIMALNLKSMGDTLGIKRAHDDRSTLIYKVAEFIGDEATQQWDNVNLTNYAPLINTSELLIKDIVLTKVNLKWSKQNKTFYSEGKIGLSNIGNVDVNVEVDGFVEIRKTPEGDMINVLLQMTDGTWYYFGHDGVSMATLSSNPAFNASILERSNVGKARPGAFTFFAATIEEVMLWAQNYKKLYFGIDEPYRLLLANESSQTLKKKDTEEGDGF